MAKVAVNGKGTKEQPWVLKTPPGTSEFTKHACFDNLELLLP